MSITRREFFLPNHDLIKQVEYLLFAEGYYYFPDAIQPTDTNLIPYRDQIKNRPNLCVLYPTNPSHPLVGGDTVYFAVHRLCRNYSMGNPYWKDWDGFTRVNVTRKGSDFPIKLLNPYPVVWDLDNYYPFSLVYESGSEVAWGTNLTKTCWVNYTKLEMEGKEPQRYLNVYYHIVKAFEEDCYYDLTPLGLNRTITLHTVDFSIFGSVTVLEDPDQISSFMAYNISRSDLFFVTFSYFFPPLYSIYRQNMRVLQDCPFFYPTRIVLVAKVKLRNNKFRVWWDGMDFLPLPTFELTLFKPPENPLRELWEKISWGEKLPPQFYGDWGYYFDLFVLAYWGLYNRLNWDCPPEIPQDTKSIRPLLDGFVGHRGVVLQNPATHQETALVYYINRTVPDQPYLSYLGLGRELFKPDGSRVDAYCLPRGGIMLVTPMQLNAGILTDLGGYTSFSPLSSFQIDVGLVQDRTRVYRNTYSYQWGEWKNEIYLNLKEKIEFGFKEGQEKVRLKVPLGATLKWTPYKQVDYQLGGEIVKWLYKGD